MGAAFCIRPVVALMIEALPQTSARIRSLVGEDVGGALRRARALKIRGEEPATADFSAH